MIAQHEYESERNTLICTIEFIKFNSNFNSTTCCHLLCGIVNLKLDLTNTFSYNNLSVGKIYLLYRHLDKIV